MLVDARPNEHPIDELLVVMSVDEKGHGICASVLPGVGSAVLVTGSTKPETIALFKRKAREYAQLSGKTVGLFRFMRGETLWLCDPSGMEAM